MSDLTPTSKIVAKEFLTEARSRLSDQQFSAFVTVMTELYAQKQTRGEALRKVDEVFGSDYKDLYLRLQGLLDRIVR